ncbi:MAG: hypothetical protein GW905_04150 [Rhodobacterales bacterium]|nr:hypothetical protein [Rhodobacterales bacterium]
MFETLNLPSIPFALSLNRSAILNRRAALASAASAGCFALRFAASMVAGG